MIMTTIRDKWTSLPTEPDICADSSEGWGGDRSGWGRGQPAADPVGAGRQRPIRLGWAPAAMRCQPMVTAMMPATIAAAPVSRRASPPSPSILRPSITPNSTLTSLAGATAATEVKVIATSTRT